MEELESQSISKSLLAFNGILVVLVVGMVFVIYGASHPIKPKLQEANIIESHIFDNVALEAKSAYVFDMTKGSVIYAKNESQQLPLASLTKLMTALTASTLVPKDSHITIKKEFLQEEGDTGLLDGESWKLKDLLDFSLMVSSNDGARSVASVIGALDLKGEDYDLGREDFITKMNVLAQTIGLKQTYFINESGLDVGDVSGGYGSAVDMEKLLEYIIRNNPELVEATKYENLNIKSNSKIHTAKNTNDSIGEIPGLIASKTGYTELAGGNLVIAFDASIGRPIIAVVLGSSEEGRFADMQLLVNSSLEYIQTN